MELFLQNQTISSLPISFPPSILCDPDPRDPPPIPMESEGPPVNGNLKELMRNPYETLSLYSVNNNKNSEKLSILYQSFSI